MLIDFQWFTLGLMIILLLLSSMGNAYVRGQLACNHCKQGEIGCPALELFNLIFTLFTYGHPSNHMNSPYRFHPSYFRHLS